MGTMSPDELLSLWKLEKMPVEMAMGHVLQNLVEVYVDIKALDASLYKLQGDVDGLIARTGTKPHSKSRRKSLKRG